MTAAQSIDTSRDGDRSVYALVGQRDDGSTYEWHSDENPAKVIATARRYARNDRRIAAEHIAEAESLESAVANVRDAVGPVALLEFTRTAVLRRLEWAEYFFGREHSRDDVWPVDKQWQLAEVRGVVTACQDLARLEEWALICESPDRDWAETLMRQTMAAAVRARHEGEAQP
jgi:hypothetical protein